MRNINDILGANAETVAGGGPQTGGEQTEPSQSSEPTSETMLENAGEREVTPATSQPRFHPKGPNGATNVRLSKSKRHLALGEGNTNIGRKSFKLPDVEAQLEGFWVDDPNTLIAQFGQYKFDIKKGTPTPSVNI